MKIQCNVCEVAEANVLCCADEAALCWSCDVKVHAANKLASKHQRVPLSDSSSPMPKCDICQDTIGYFFCLEDRALLCRKCDVAIHTVNNYVSSHQRFLLTGVKVGLDEVGASTSTGRSPANENLLETRSHLVSKEIKQTSLNAQSNRASSCQVDTGDCSTLNIFPSGGGCAAGSPQWQMDDEYLGLTGFNQNYGFMDYNGTSKADSGKLSDSDCSSMLRSSEEGIDGDECIGQVPDSSWMVPEMPSPPTASGLNWPKMYHNHNQLTMDAAAAFVPDVGFMPLRKTSHNSKGGPKRRRQF
ncbi:B-box zinc finger protein 22-like [Impatiens glandulifera]|uniref:B-box zinc finger protein 22-like n=1 Tax=Impatiens glandulifera TaxID=253017 RepID=UPI001FB108E5|nr:B-box zinc finger protein 22-like [Impatiens glandulifera]